MSDDDVLSQARSKETNEDPSKTDNDSTELAIDTSVDPNQEKFEQFKESAYEKYVAAKTYTVPAFLKIKQIGLKCIRNIRSKWGPLKELMKRFTHLDSDIYRTTQRFCIRNPAILIISAVILFLLMYKFLTYVDELEDNILDEVTLVEKFHPYNFNKYVIPGNSTQKKLVIFSYNRGGASILGHIFNLNPTAVYWYEPLQAFYTHMFGNKVFALPNEITHKENGLRRDMSKEEINNAAAFITNLLSCKFEEIPVEAFSIESIVERKIEWMHSFRECMLGKVDNPTVRHCMEPLAKHCGAMTTHCIKERCDYFNELARQAQTADQRERATQEVAKKNRKRFKEFLVKEDCMRDLVQAQSYCLPDLHVQCVKANLNVIKAYRTSPAVLEEVLKQDPHVFVVHYFRDPRAMIWSRYKSDTLSVISGKKDKTESDLRHMEREARMLCRQLVQDILKISKIKKTYADRMAIFRYEDFVANPNATIAYIYGRLGESYSDTLPKRIETLMHSKTANDGPFGYHREDATVTANKWQEDIDPEVKVFIDNECKGVLTALQYQV